MKQDKRMIVVGFLLLMIGFLSGWLAFLMFGDIAGQVRVLFVSMDRVIRLEEERLKEKPVEQRVLFFGKQDEALEKMLAIARSLENRRTKVVFVSTTNGKVLGGRAISEAVHRELIKELEGRKNDK